MSSAVISTYKHIARVRELLGEFAREMIVRGDIHDKSKFDPIEMGPLEEMQKIIDTEGNVPYESDERKRRTAILGPMIEHHYANNSHHPEHRNNGIAGMNLFDLVEMFYDWKASSERGEESAISLSHSKEKYNIPDMLFSILVNTAEKQGYAWK